MDEVKEPSPDKAWLKHWEAEMLGASEGVCNILCGQAYIAIVVPKRPRLCCGVAWLGVMIVPLGGGSDVNNIAGLGLHYCLDAECVPYSAVAIDLIDYSCVLLVVIKWKIHQPGEEVLLIHENTTAMTSTLRSYMTRTSTNRKTQTPTHTHDMEAAQRMPAHHATKTSAHPQVSTEARVECTTAGVQQHSQPVRCMIHTPTHTHTLYTLPPHSTAPRSTMSQEHTTTQSEHARVEQHTATKCYRVACTTQRTTTLPFLLVI